MKLSDNKSKLSDEELKQYVYSVPEKQTPDVKKEDEPDFSAVDNPRTWNEHIFRPEFKTQKQGGQYKGHFLTTIVPHQFLWEQMGHLELFIIVTFIMIDRKAQINLI